MTSDQMDMKKLRKVILYNLFNQTFITLPCCYGYHYVAGYRGNVTSAALMPSFMIVLFEICFFALVEEIMFYYGHRLASRPVAAQVNGVISGSPLYIIPQYKEIKALRFYVCIIELYIKTCVNECMWVDKI